MSLRQALVSLVLCASITFPHVQPLRVFGATLGPYKAIARELFICEDNGQGQIKYNTRINVIGRNKYAFSGNISMPDIDDKNTEILVNCTALSTNGGVKKNIFVTRFKRACTEALRFSSDFLNSLSKSIGQQVPVKCPIKGGSYEINQLPTVTHFNFPLASYGTIRVEIGIIKKRTRVGCLGLVLDFVPP